MLPLEVVGPRWQPLNVALCYVILARCQSKRVLAGSSSDGGRQLQLKQRQRLFFGSGGCWERQWQWCYGLSKKLDFFALHTLSRCIRLFS